jgi:tol-pal system protein YbgF
MIAPGSFAQIYDPTRPPPAVAPGKAPAQQKNAAPAQPRAAPEAVPARTDAQLRQRIEDLEKEIVDMHVLVGTLETLARQGGGSAASYSSGVPLTGQEASRIAALETQVAALAAQVEQLSAQVRALSGGGGGASAGVAGDPRRPAPGGPPPRSAPAAIPGFGSTVITPGGDTDPIGTLITGPNAGRQGSFGGGASMGPKQAYETAYAQLLQQDYDGAEAGFTDFLAQYPSDGLAANAQYWLGETYFLRQQWDQAAQAFYKVAQNYGNSVKAPDSLAKLAMSLDRNGKRPAACAALGELNKRFPNPPAHVKNWEQAERKRTGCT